MARVARAFRPVLPAARSNCSRRVLHPAGMDSMCTTDPQASSQPSAPHDLGRAIRGAPGSLQLHVIIPPITHPETTDSDVQEAADWLVRRPYHSVQQGWIGRLRRVPLAP